MKIGYNSSGKQYYNLDSRRQTLANPSLRDGTAGWVDSAIGSMAE